MSSAGARSHVAGELSKQRIPRVTARGPHVLCITRSPSYVKPTELAYSGPSLVARRNASPGSRRALSVRSTPEVNTHPTRHALAFEQFPGLYTVLLRTTCGHKGGCLRVYVAPAAEIAISSQVGGSTAVLALIERVPCFITLCASKPVRHVDDRSPSLRLPL